MSFPPFSVVTTIFLPEQELHRHEQSRLCTFEVVDGTATVEVLVRFDWHWIVVIAGGTEAALTRTFQKVQIELPTQLDLAVTHEAGEIHLVLNGRWLLPEEASPPGTLYLPPDREVDVPPSKSYLNQASEVACAEAVQKRRRHFLAKSGYQDKKFTTRPKTLPEQVDELHDSAIELRRLLERAHQGDRHAIRTIAGELRSLIYQPESNKSTFNPLLYRVANIMQCALPVYTRSVMPKLDIDGLVSFSDNVLVSTDQPGSNYVLCDLQEYLDKEVILTRRAKTETASVQDVIHKFASSAAVGHYDDVVSLILDDMRGVGVGGRNLLQQVLIAVAECVAELTFHVLQQYELRYGTVD